MSAETRQFPSIIAILLLVAFVFTTVPARAHVEGQMPDSVAEMEYRILLEFKPDDSASRVKLALVLMNQDKLEDAEKEFNRVLAGSPLHLQAHIGLSRLRVKQHRTAEALELIKEALVIAPDKPATFLNYGMILEANHRPREARQMYRDGLEKVAGNPDPEALHDRQQLENALKKVEEKLSGIDQVN